MIDCTTFQGCEIDALYSDGDARELDDEARAAMEAHAATCADCAERLARLKKTRGLVLSVAIEPVPSDFESRIMAAVDASLAKRASVVPIGAAKPDRSAKVVSLFSRPSFAVAATFVLVIGAGALILARSGTSMKSLAANDEAPSMPAAVAASGLTPVPAVVAAAPAATERAGGPIAMNADGDEDPNGAHGRAREGKPSAPLALGAPPPTKHAAKARPSGGGGGGDSAAFAAAKSLFNAGRYAEALPKFEALSAQDPEADLYAARCVARTQGCKAAEARYDTAAQTNAGTEAGSRAQLEGARCYQSTGDVVAARRRYSAAKDEGILENEAQKALQELDQTGGGSGAAGGANAAPKAAAPAPRAPSATESK